jgi:hypothetical protein
MGHYEGLLMGLMTTVKFANLGRLHGTKDKLCRGPERSIILNEAFFIKGGHIYGLIQLLSMLKPHTQ